MLDTYVVLHAAFVSSLHKIVGVEFGMSLLRLSVMVYSEVYLAAFFVQNVVSSYERHLNDLRAPVGEPDTPEGETRGKECSNLIVLLSELYNFQVISCVLIYDVICDLLSGDLTEFDVELLLKLLRSEFDAFNSGLNLSHGNVDSGQQLRHDDPSALKDIIEIVQKKTGEDKQASRCVYSLCARGVG